MARLAYDLHIHSALSPCGDADMTPNNIVNMALLKGLGLVALTDHNTARNCPALLEAASRAGLTALPGMELSTSEEIHVVCLFPRLERALEFDRYVYERLPAIANKPDIFGQQQVLDDQDRVIGEEPRLLITATSISVMEVPALMGAFGGFAFPAHIDRSSYSILASLGAVPPECVFPVYELHEPERLPELSALIPNRDEAVFLHSSDAHYLWDISEANYTCDFAAIPGFPLPAGL